MFLSRRLLSLVIVYIVVLDLQYVIWNTFHVGSPSFFLIFNSIIYAIFIYKISSTYILKYLKVAWRRWFFHPSRNLSFCFNYKFQCSPWIPCFRVYTFLSSPSITDLRNVISPGRTLLQGLAYTWSTLLFHIAHRAQPFTTFDCIVNEVNVFPPYVKVSKYTPIHLSLIHI